jgi:cytochrome c biogenesis protein CcdA
MLHLSAYLGVYLIGGLTGFMAAGLLAGWRINELRLENERIRRQMRELPGGALTILMNDRKYHPETIAGGNRDAA